MNHLLTNFLNETMDGPHTIFVVTQDTNKGVRRLGEVVGCVCKAYFNEKYYGRDAHKLALDMLDMLDKGVMWENALVASALAAEVAANKVRMLRIAAEAAEAAEAAAQWDDMDNEAQGDELCGLDDDDLTYDEYGEIIANGL